MQVRLFSVIKYESVIHEFDPYFNYRVTRFLTWVLPQAGRCCCCCWLVLLVRCGCYFF